MSVFHLNINSRLRCSGNCYFAPGMWGTYRTHTQMHAQGGAAAAEGIETMAANAAKVMNDYPAGSKKDD